MIKMMIVEPDEVLDLKKSIIISPADIILTGPITNDDLGKEVRKLLAGLAKEKRAFLRVPAIENPPVKVGFGGEDFAILRDLGETGMFLQTVDRGRSFSPPPDVELNVGDAHPFIIHISDIEHWRVEGIVVRAEESGAGVGIAFRSMDEETRRKIFTRLADTVASKEIADLILRYPEPPLSKTATFRSVQKIRDLLEEAQRSPTGITAFPIRSR